jgi:hypothetical protein
MAADETHFLENAGELSVYGDSDSGTAANR